MADFQKWYTMIKPEKIPALDPMLSGLQQAYEAGAASQAKTLRDEFAGQAMAATVISEGGSYEAAIADWSYMMADAMLEARKPPEEDQGSRSDPNVESAVTEGSDFPCIDHEAKDALARVLADDGMSICGADEVARVAVNLLDRAGWQITRKEQGS
jgi:hypothetical protein